MKVYGILKMVLALATVVFLFVASSSSLRATESAPSPQFLVSWRASSYAPYDYRGKVLPTEDTNMSASFDILASGKIADLSKNKIIWAVNGREVSEGLNQKSVIFKNYSFANSSIGVEIRVLGFRGATLVHSFEIPSASPEAVVSAPYNKSGFKERKLNLTLLPYFFNVKDLSELSLVWSINGKSPEGAPEKPENLAIRVPDETPSGTVIEVAGFIKNKKNGLESARAQTALTLQ